MQFPRTDEEVILGLLSAIEERDEERILGIISPETHNGRSRRSRGRRAALGIAADRCWRPADLAVKR